MTTLKEAFLKKYPAHGIILRMYEEANGCHATWSNLSKLRLQAFADYLCGKVSPNSARQYCAKLKAVLNLYSEEVELPRGYSKVLSLKAEKAVSVWLTDDELSLLANYQPATPNELLVRNQFLIGAYSGCRHSDFLRLDETNIVEGMLTYVSVKTRIQATVPLKPIVAELLRTTEKREVSDPTFNETLRTICKGSGINGQVKVYRAGTQKAGEKWQFVSSHTARRSFATNLYLRGADLYSISRMLGHASVEMTANNYICCGLKEQPEKVMEYFK